MDNLTGTIQIVFYIYSLRFSLSFTDIVFNNYGYLIYIMCHYKYDMDLINSIYIENCL